MTNLVEVNNEQVVTTSLVVAETFGKRHNNVMRDIEGFLPNSYFIKSKYTHPQNNQTYPMCYMTKEGFLLLTSSYRGKGVLEKKMRILSGTDMIPPSLPERKETEFFLELSQSLKGFEEELTLYQQYNILDYRIDGYIKELNLAIEYDESHHLYSEKEDIIRQVKIEKALNCRILRLSSEDTNAKNIGLVFGEMFKIMKEDMHNE